MSDLLAFFYHRGTEEEGEHRVKKPRDQKGDHFKKPDIKSLLCDLPLPLCLCGQGKRKSVSALMKGGWCERLR